ncbi:hypothetical protein HYU50_03135 [Candidatus Woesearchaeota archaeon]|nr:hypothetical protein [Candidatus Woesearchaeota archaeon]
MAAILGTRYAETKERLREAIRNGTISVLEIEVGNFSSYFTLKPIKENPIMLVEIDENGTRKYFISREEYGACCPNNERLLRFYKGSSSIN